MTRVLLQPHQDDAALFAAFTCWLEKPLIVTVLQSHVQANRGTGITNAERDAEDDCAFAILGCESVRWSFRDDAPDWQGIRTCIEELAQRHDHCYAPAVEPGGHEHHNAIGMLAADVFRGNVTHYTTYVNGRGRSVGSSEVAPTPGGIAAKLRALACYTSQIDLPSTGHHFMQPLTEWYA